MSHNARRIVGNFPCTGMHGGEIILRGNTDNIAFPKNVCVKSAADDDIESIRSELTEFCKVFGCDMEEIMNSEFTVATPDSKNPYKQMYVAN